MGGGEAHNTQAILSILCMCVCVWTAVSYLRTYVLHQEIGIEKKPFVTDLLA